MDKDYLVLKRASASRPSGEWNDDDFDVLADGAVVGRIFKVHAAPVSSPWMWTLAFGHHEDRTPTHGYEPTRETVMRSPRAGGGNENARADALKPAVKKIIGENWRAPFKSSLTDRGCDPRPVCVQQRLPRRSGRPSKCHPWPRHGWGTLVGRASARIVLVFTIIARLEQFRRETCVGNSR